MRLSQQQMNVVLMKFKTMFTEKNACPMCKKDSWSISDRFYEMKEFGLNENGTQQTSPFIIMSCKTCGHSRFFNALILGFEFTPKVDEHEDKHTESKEDDEDKRTES